MNETLTALGFNEIINKLKVYAMTRRGTFLIENLDTFIPKEDLESELSKVDECFRFLVKFNRPPISSSEDLSEIILEAKKGRTLTIAQINNVLGDLINVRKLLGFFSSKLEGFPFLKEFTLAFETLEELEEKITKIISPSLMINDKASKELYKIRQKINSLTEKITREANAILIQHEELLTGDNLTMRNGHYVIPVKSGFKKSISGIIHDVSSSGQTVFIEPEVIVALNNELIALKNDELIEINRLLTYLTQQIAAKSDILLKNNELIGRLDFLFAKAQLGREMDGFIASISNRNEIHLKDARHPLIPKNKVVANSFNFDEENHLIIISGPNAGGKTVVLKTIGLLVIMNQMGLMIPVSTPPKLGYFPNVYVDIGDQQSLSDNLSTFSGHMQNIAFILANAKKHDLVLLDELGTGTSPLEGEALAIAICEELRKKGCITVVSSHFNKLKNYAANNVGSINASMLFDEETLSPTYIFRQGLPGQSYGLEVASRYGIGDDVIGGAKDVIEDQKDLSVDALLNKLQKEIKENEALKEKLELTQEELSKEIEKQEKLNRTLIEEKQKILKEADKAVEKEIERVNKELSLILEEAHKGNLKPHEIIELKAKVPTRKAELKVKNPPFDGKVGDYARIVPLDIVGKVTRLTRERAELTLENKRIMTVKTSDLTNAAKPENKKKPTKRVPIYVSNQKESVGPSINLIGYRVSDALNELELYLDKALLNNYKSVRVIHGFGSGALKNAIHQYLKTLPFVDNFHFEKGERSSNAGATIVEFK